MEKVEEGRRRLEKVGEDWRRLEKLEKVGGGWRKYEKGMKKYEKA